MAYGTVKCDNVIYDDSGDQTLSVANIATKASPSFTGAVGVAGEFDITGQYNQTVPTALATTGALTVDTSLGNYFTIPTMTGNITGFTFTNLPASGKAYSFTLEIATSGTPHTITWTPTVGGATKNWYWPGDAPTLEATKTFLVSVVTDDGGATFRAIATKAYTN
jgi:hypothetical protein